MVCFHVLWSEECLKLMPSVAELVPTLYQQASFLSARADARGMEQLSKEKDIKQFPTFLLLRGGKEITRITGKERVVDRIVKAIKKEATEKEAAEECKAKKHRASSPPEDQTKQKKQKTQEQHEKHESGASTGADSDGESDGEASGEDDSQ